MHFNLSPPSLQEVEIPLIDRKDDSQKVNLLSLPIYLVGELERLITESDLLIETSISDVWHSSASVVA